MTLGDHERIVTTMTMMSTATTLRSTSPETYVWKLTPLALAHWLFPRSILELLQLLGTEANFQDHAHKQDREYSVDLAVSVYPDSGLGQEVSQL